MDNLITKELVLKYLSTDNKTSLVAAINELNLKKANIEDLPAPGTDYALPAATTSVLGGVKIGTNITVSAGTISVPDGTTAAKGLLKLNNTLTSTATTEALTAAQGKALNDLITTKADKSYVDTRVANLVGAAPAALDTLEELATAVSENQTIVEGILTTIGNKADGGDFGLHTGNTTVHITAAERTAWNAKAETTVVTAVTNGLMSKEDKAKLDGIAAGATSQDYTLPAATASVLGGVTIGENLVITAGKISVENASIAAKGVVQLNNTATSTAVDQAATASALKTVKDILDEHAANTNNPHNVTKAQIGLGSLQNYPIATTEEALAGTLTNKYVTPALVKAYVDQELSKLRNEIISVLIGEMG